MVTRQDTPPSLDFELDPSSPSKRPEQFVILLERALEQEFPEALEIIDIWHAPGNGSSASETWRSSTSRPPKTSPTKLGEYSTTS